MLIVPRRWAALRYASNSSQPRSGYRRLASNWNRQFRARGLLEAARWTLVGLRFPLVCPILGRQAEADCRWPTDFG
jgi:hypothetical protein